MQIKNFYFYIGDFRMYGIKEVFTKKIALKIEDPTISPKDFNVCDFSDPLDMEICSFQAQGVKEGSIVKLTRESIIELRDSINKALEMNVE